MRSQEDEVPGTVLGLRRTGGEGFLPCASMAVPLTAQHPRALGQLLCGPGVCVSGAEVEVASRLSSVRCACPLIWAKGCACLYTCPQAHLQTASVDMEGRSD